MAVLLGLAVAPFVGLGEERDHGSGTTERHPESSGDQDTVVIPDVLPQRPPPVLRASPGVAYFWSDRCVSQRRDGLRHTQDCDNPAYTGSRYARPGFHPRAIPRFVPDRPRHVWPSRNGRIGIGVNP